MLFEITVSRLPLNNIYFGDLKWVIMIECSVNDYCYLRYGHKRVLELGML